MDWAGNAVDMDFPVWHGSTVATRGEALRAWIEHRGASQRAIALSARINKGTLSDLVNDVRPGTLKTWRKIAAYLDVTTDVLLGGILPTQLQRNDTESSASAVSEDRQEHFRKLLTENVLAQPSPTPDDGDGPSSEPEGTKSVQQRKERLWGLFVHLPEHLQEQIMAEVAELAIPEIERQAQRARRPKARAVR